MSEPLEKAQEELQGKLQVALDEAFRLKKTINTLCEINGMDPLYSDIESESARGGVGPIRPGIYYGKQLATAVREYLDRAKQAADPEVILRAMEQGGFDFDALGWTDKNRLRNLSISLSKNTSAFRRLPNGMFGLEAWYEDVVKRRKPRVRSPRRPVSFEDDPDVIVAEVVEDD